MPVKNNFVLAAVGEVLWDIYPEGRYPGGATFNFIHHVEQLGQKGVLFSRLGDDPDGRELLEIMREKNYNTDFVQIDKNNPTGYVKVTLDENKVPSFKGADNAAYYYLEWDNRFAEVKDKIDAVLFGTYTQRTPQIMDITKKYLLELKDSLRIFDVNFRWWHDDMKNLVSGCLEHTDVLKMNESEYEKICGLYSLSRDYKTGVVEMMKKFDLRLVSLTLGEYGCILADGNETVYCPGLSVEPVDTTGAGDAFVAAMATGYLKGDPLKKIGESANAVAAYTSTKRGAAPEYDMEDIEGMKFPGYNTKLI
ncbi:MAG: carbohydrate kinase [bacterium]|nr:carbohydrate kinase [bacterium]